MIVPVGPVSLDTGAIVSRTALTDKQNDAVRNKHYQRHDAQKIVDFDFTMDKFHRIEAKASSNHCKQIQHHKRYNHCDLL